MNTFVKLNAISFLTCYKRTQHQVALQGSSAETLSSLSSSHPHHGSVTQNKRMRLHLV